ncbi:Mediator of rna polymerase ii transcription subunit 15a [Thalictrum thalictroides]|uniref:Mediator of rna polymerase ii transcription subunit 15a n=1 Tax=Thalictrum thalictroides TaxID=46969 RepID=A0A7J6V9F7_THATH|nr:Mediator of rna polymerase ii transcription subunit 15a [Thalictrum thalictroides]
MSFFSSTLLGLIKLLKRTQTIRRLFEGVRYLYIHLKFAGHIHQVVIIFFIHSATTQSGQVNTADWQEETYQKIKAMKEIYLPDLHKMHQKLSLRFQQHETVTQRTKEEIDKLRLMKTYLERIITFLQVSKSNIPFTHRDKLDGYERQIINFLNSNRIKKPVPAN